MNDALKIENNDIMNKFQKTENILNDVQNIIEVSQKEAIVRLIQFCHRETG